LNIDTHLIYKHPDWLDQKVLVNLDELRDLKFNAGEKIEVSSEELNAIGNHRWLIVENYNGD
jgi:hypothetical protein